jgi:hypothetical protein
MVADRQVGEALDRRLLTGCRVGLQTRTRAHLAPKTGTCEYRWVNEKVSFSNDLKRLRKLRALSATVSCVAAIGFAVNLYIVITGYHPANRVTQIAWLPTYALMACAYFLRFRTYSARIATVTQSTNRTELKP